MTYIPTIPIRDLIEVEFEESKDFLRNMTRLELACKDGNINKNKHTIVFSTKSGLLKVKATIWMVGKNYILLKENLYIPIKSIIDVI
jgi:hypothetical protein|tara:strand:+ start:412 stop:672 length:261 start_codon:yes stop_codon:yes gene_type:complete